MRTTLKLTYHITREVWVRPSCHHDRPPALWPGSVGGIRGLCLCRLGGGVGPAPALAVHGSEGAGVALVPGGAGLRQDAEPAAAAVVGEPAAAVSRLAQGQTVVGGGGPGLRANTSALAAIKRKLNNKILCLLAIVSTVPESVHEADLVVAIIVSRDAVVAAVVAKFVAVEVEVAELESASFKLVVCSQNIVLDFTPEPE